VHHTPFEKFPQQWITHNWDDQHPNPNQVDPEVRSACYDAVNIFAHNQQKYWQS
jgi:hypothetical protein